MDEDNLEDDDDEYGDYGNEDEELPTEEAFLPEEGDREDFVPMYVQQMEKTLREEMQFESVEVH